MNENITRQKSERLFSIELNLGHACAASCASHHWAACRRT
jgi:hypothetical protein